MAGGSSTGGTGVAGSSGDASGLSEETVNINIKTLDSRVFTLRVDKKKPVSLLKEDIAGAVRVPPEQQRLIFKGKVLKHDHLLSEYNIEDGDTLHLVARQPVQSQSGIGSDEIRSTGSRGNEATGTIPRARIGHSVVLGLNIGDQGGNTAIDLSQIIGSVLNTFGVGTTINTWAGENASSNSTTSQSAATGAQNSNGRSPAGNQSSQTPPPGTLLRHMVIPDSLTTLLAFIRRMEQVLSLHSGYQLPLPSDTHGPMQSVQFPSLDALITVLERAQQLLSGPAAMALSHLSGHLERERGSTDIAVRSQIQAEAMHVAVAMQHLGSLLLELGRSVSTLRMGETPAESLVNTGPAVYISASGPNTIMVQPAVQQTGSLFATPFPPTINIGVPEVGMGGVSGDISIPVDAGGNSDTAGVPLGSRANTGEPSNQGTTQNSSNYFNSSLAAGDEPQCDDYITVPPLPTSSEVGAETNVSTAPSHSAEREGLLDSNLRPTGQTPPNVVFSKACESSGGSDSSSLQNSNISMPGVPELKSLPDISEACSNEHAGKGLAKDTASTHFSYHSGSLDRASGNSLGSNERKESNEPVPLGLGLGALKSKKWSKQSSSRRKNAELQSSDDGNHRLIAKGQEVLQSLISQTSRPEVNGTSAASNLDFTPHSRTSQLVQGQDQNLGGMLSGMFQQMMPVISQTLSMDSSKAQPSTSFASGFQHSTVGNNLLNGGNHEIGLQLVVDGIEREDSPRNIFCNLLGAVGQLLGSNNSDLSEALCNDEELINAFCEMMRRQLKVRLQSGTRRHMDEA